MRYLKATQVLPPELLAEVQQYVDGEYLYIPRLPEKKQGWGENTSTRQLLNRRNRDILSAYQSGVDIQTLSEQYFLTPKSIRRILSRMEKE